jgi:hypothetical protein
MGAYDFMYEQTDIPPGMTIRQWHTQRAVQSSRLRAEAREARRRRQLWRLRRWLELLRPPTARGLRGREAHG